MVSKSALKFIKSLKIKKYRDLELRFLVEGPKNILELIRSDFEVLLVIGTTIFLNQYEGQLRISGCEIYQATQAQIESAGSLKANDCGIAVVHMRPNTSVEIGTGEYGLVLDNINDPGNLGTLLRIADWYGIRKIICSNNTTDFYGPKVIQASMGSFTRVEVFYTELTDYLKLTDRPVYGSFTKGDNIHQIGFDQHGLVLLGSESHGIHPTLERFVNHRIAIPGYGQAESLNVAVAAAVICDNIRRTTA